MEDVTIEDEYQSNEDIYSNTEVKTNILWSILFEILNKQWIIFLFLAIFIATIIYLNNKWKENLRSTVLSNDHSNNLDVNMSHVRKQQQKLYEEQALRYAEQQISKISSSKSNPNEISNRSTLRTNDHNPLTGQSNNGSNKSCSWRPSSSRQKGPGG